MRIADRSFAAWTATFYAALGLTPLSGCGGTVVAHDADGGSGGKPIHGGNGPGGSASGGETTTGGVTASGGKTATGGATAAGGSTAIGGATSAGGTGFVPCVPGTGAGSGFEACDTGTLHRPSKQVCSNKTPRPDSAIAPGTGGAPSIACTKDADCTEKPYGYCVRAIGFIGASCAYGCTNDGECGEGQICMCGDPVGHCVEATCTEDRSCNGGLCASYDPSAGCGGTAFACQSTRDVCLSDADCPSAQHCLFSAEQGTRFCSSVRCTVGRPFVVGGAARVAPLCERDDFSSGLWPDVRALGDQDRNAIAAYWADVGLMEHASVAAFARFALELLSLGAPPSLLAATHAAMADEMAHARDAFALAGAYAARAIGPGPLDTSSALANRSPLDVVRTAIVEGCIGETVAAVTASEALRHTKDPAVRAALARVVPDETRHAELAWRFVQWVLHDGPVELRAAAARELVTLVESEILSADADIARDDVASDVLRAHGVLTPAENAAIRARVLSEVVLPCARALGEPARSEAPVPAASALASLGSV